jgi:hypothetical protein
MFIACPTGLLAGLRLLRISHRVCISLCMCAWVFYLVKAYSTASHVKWDSTRHKLSSDCTKHSGM